MIVKAAIVGGVLPALVMSTQTGALVPRQTCPAACSSCVSAMTSTNLSPRVLTTTCSATPYLPLAVMRQSPDPAQANMPATIIRQGKSSPRGIFRHQPAHPTQLRRKAMRQVTLHLNPTAPVVGLMPLLHHHIPLIPRLRNTRLPMGMGMLRAQLLRTMGARLPPTALVRLLLPLLPCPVLARRHRRRHPQAQTLVTI
jgi:hypothetical protein